MNCPLCDHVMKSIEQCGVEADLCPACKGIWLGRGKLERIMAVVSAREGAIQTEYEAYEEVAPPPRQQAPSGRVATYGQEQDDDAAHGSGRYEGHSQSNGRRESWLNRLVDAFGD